jgi:hypothetical protein
MRRQIASRNSAGANAPNSASHAPPEPLQSALGILILVHLICKQRFGKRNSALFSIFELRLAERPWSLDGVDELPPGGFQDAQDESTTHVGEIPKSQYASSPVYAPGLPISTWCIVGGGVLGTLRAAYHSLSPNAASEKFSNACPARHHLHTATPSVMGSNLDRWQEGLPPI